MCMKVMQIKIYKQSHTKHLVGDEATEVGDDGDDVLQFFGAPM